LFDLKINILIYKSRNLLVLFFLLIFFVKVFLSIFLNGPTTFPDESCFALRAMDIVDNFTMRHCEDISGFDSGGEFPLNVFYFVPVFYFFRGVNAFYALMFLNSFISAFLLFPFFGIFKRFLKKESLSIFLSVVMVFIPQIFLYEKSMMSDFLFSVLGVWFLFFYIKSFEKNGFKSKIIAFVFAILGALTRPFGFILPVSVFINELIVYKKLKYLFVSILGVSLSIFLLWFFQDESQKWIMEKLVSLQNLKNYLFILKSLINQFNSFIISLFLIPILTFLLFFRRKNFKIWDNTKWFFAIFIFLNFLMSAQHIYGYFLENLNLHILTRYINLSGVYLLLLCLVYLSKFKKEKIDFKVILIFSLAFLSFVFLEKTGKRVQNVDVSALYYVSSVVEAKRTEFLYFLKFPFLAFYLFFFVLFAKQKFIWLRNIIIVSILSFSVFGLLTIIKTPVNTSLSNAILNNPDAKITYILTPQRKGLIHYWKLMAHSNYEIIRVVNFDENKLFLDYSSLDTDLIVSFFDLPGLEILGTTVKDDLLYKIYKKNN
jgi:hypothetical protein